MKKSLWASAIVAALALGAGGNAGAAVIWSNSACFCSGGTHLQAFDATTGAMVREWVAPTDNFSQNGRGVVLVGDVLYYTVVDDPKIYKLDANTGASLGSITTSVASMSTIGWDGTAFWTSDYTGAKNAYRIDPVTGATIKTVVLPNAGNFYDGLEFFNGKLIANRGDIVAPYDVYDLDGNLLQSAFLNPPAGTGIAFDGTNFYVSRFTSIDIFNGTTGAFISNLPLLGNGFTLIEDLSFDYSQRSDTGGGTPVPEPTTLSLVAVGLLGVGLVSRRRRSVLRQS